MNPSISFERVVKRFQLGPPPTLLELVQRLGRPPARPQVLALAGATFEVRSGEAVGIIGANGSGKSTILKLTNGILRPNDGRVQVVGRVGALIELGAGMHPDFTGRENIFVNGAIMGLRRDEIRGRFDEIVEFAGIGPFLDTPVKHYSSGMFARLGFAIAAHIDADVLLIDEVLAVGDEAFQRRCIDRVRALRGGGAALLFVSHLLDQVRAICTRVIWLDRGQIEAEGAPDDVIRRYLESVDAESSAKNG